MRKIFHVSLILFAYSLSAFAQNEADTEKYFQHIQHQEDIARMNFFFSQMPKGGDLHHHFGGSLYAESYLEWLEEKAYFLHTQSLRAQKDTCDTCIPIAAVLKDESLFEQVLERWSTQDYEHKLPAQVPPDQHFFNTFAYFGNSEFRDYAEGFQKIKSRAIRENVQYIETQAKFAFFPANLASFNPEFQTYQKNRDTSSLYLLFTTLEKILLEKGIEEYAQQYIQELTAYHKGIDDEAFTLRFQAYIVRNMEPSQVFANLFAAYLAVANGDLVVGVNIVAPEHGRISMRDYWLHMHMFRFLSQKYPQVKKSLHAGELALGMVKPEDLSYHITDALFVAGADRIGHGVDMPYENQAIQSMTYMATNGKALEVNLTSNAFILGVSGPEHPINLYREFGVPMVISTDDSGVSRNSLTNEYSLLARNYDFSYAEIKRLAYNGITYSFLNKSDKEENIQRMDASFEVFEEKIARIYRKYVAK